MDFGLKINAVLYTNPKNTVRVCLATDVATNEVFVVKELWTKRYLKARHYAMEFWTHSAMHHPHICRFLKSAYSYSDKEKLYKSTLVMERQAVDLETLVRNQRKPFAEEQLWQWLKECVDALAYAQERSVCHRDIKPKNLLLTDDGHIKVADFGFSRYVESSSERFTWLGTERYLSPALQDQREVWRAGDHSFSKVLHNPFKSDVYSLGMTMYFTARGCLPKVFKYESLGQVCNLTTARQYRYSREFGEVLRTMMQPREEDRMDFKELKKWLETHYFRQLDGQVAATEAVPLSMVTFTTDTFLPENICQIEAQSPICLFCSTDIEENKGIALPCNSQHLVCSADCLAKAVSEAGFHHTLCKVCDKQVGEKFLKATFQLYGKDFCHTCQSKVHKVYRVAQCHHQFCKEHFQLKRNDCQVCGIPYVENKSRRVNSDFRRGIYKIYSGIKEILSYYGFSGAPISFTMATLALAPMRFAPAATIARRSAAVRTPPAAFTPVFGPTTPLISAMSAAVAPEVEKPVEVFTKSAPATAAS